MGQGVVMARHGCWTMGRGELEAGGQGATGAGCACETRQVASNQADKVCCGGTVCRLDAWALRQGGCAYG
jgi:hypothetical protein